jgi:hypothetical protein
MYLWESKDAQAVKILTPEVYFEKSSDLPQNPLRNIEILLKRAMHLRRSA